jgi:hypothetical protein
MFSVRDRFVTANAAAAAEGRPQRDMRALNKEVLACSVLANHFRRIYLQVRQRY